MFRLHVHKCAIIECKCENPFLFCTMLMNTLYMHWSIWIRRDSDLKGLLFIYWWWVEHALPSSHSSYPFVYRGHFIRDQHSLMVRTSCLCSERSLTYYLAPDWNAIHTHKWANTVSIDPKEGQRAYWHELITIGQLIIIISRLSPPLSYAYIQRTCTTLHSEPCPSPFAL